MGFGWNRQLGSSLVNRRDAKDLAIFLCNDPRALWFMAGLVSFLLIGPIEILSAVTSVILGFLWILWVIVYYGVMGLLILVLMVAATIAVSGLYNRYH